MELIGGTAVSLASGVTINGSVRLTAAEPEFRLVGLGPSGKLVGVVPFVNEGLAQMDSAFGAELDGRLFTSLDRLSEKMVVTPEERFYVRTRASRLLPQETGWTIMVGAGESAFRLNHSELKGSAKPQGLHLLECAGNTRAAHFGMISVGDWTGVPVAEVLERAHLTKMARVLVSGFDRYETNSVTSTPGASWIFTQDEIWAARAFLATELNGKPLSKDHGAPVRLVVPGWYGCTCIKWVNEITMLDEAAEATSQMQEYAGRTHQNGVPKLAKDFTPARIAHAAMPIRIEQWSDDGKVFYRVIGLLWGGTQSVKRLGIRFNPEEEYAPVEQLPTPQTNPWTMWAHTWRPAAAGTYTIRLAVLEPELHPKRLESGYYARSVEIRDI